MSLSLMIVELSKPAASTACDKAVELSGWTPQKWSSGVRARAVAFESRRIRLSVCESPSRQIGFSKQIAENLIDEFFSLIVKNLRKEKKLKISNFGTFSIREKKSRIGRNPKTKEEKNISKRNVVLFKPSKEFKKLINEKINE